MSKLSDIVVAATTDSVAVAALLRKVKAFASRIENPPLLDWVDHELQGYPMDATVPSYRGPFPAHVLSEWSGPGSIARNVPLAPSSVPEGMRNIGAFEITFHESVAELERHAQSTDPIAYIWPNSAVAILNRQMKTGSWPEIMPGYGLVSACRTISSARAAAVLDNVKTRILNLALDLEKVAPDAGESGATLADPSTVNNIITTNIFGHGNAVAVGSPGAVQLGGVHAVQVNDLQSLLSAASSLGLAPEDVTDLKQAIEDDASDDNTPKGKPGSRVAQFIGKVTLGGLKSVGQAGVQEGAKILGEWVRAYYGI